jgi:hypothetical protein
MRTTIIIVAGLAILGVMAFGSWRLGGSSAAVTAGKWFIAFWLLVALVNMWLGVSRAGYSVGEELPIFLVIFLVPAGAATLLWWKLSQPSA